MLARDRLFGCGALPHLLSAIERSHDRFIFAAVVIYLRNLSYLKQLLATASRWHAQASRHTQKPAIHAQQIVGSNRRCCAELGRLGERFTQFLPACVRSAGW